MLYSRIAPVHVHGHASQEELKMMLALTRPRFFVPIHGEYRHLVAHAALARSMGIPESNNFVLEDGDVLELTEESGQIVDKVRTGHVYVDGRTLWDMDSEVLAQRRRLSRDGVVTVAITLSKQSGEALMPPTVTSLGFVELDESQELFEKTSRNVLLALETAGGGILQLDRVKDKITDSVSNLLYNETRRRPRVLTVIQEI